MWKINYKVSSLIIEGIVFSITQIMLYSILTQQINLIKTGHKNKMCYLFITSVFTEISASSFIFMQLIYCQKTHEKAEDLISYYSFVLHAMILNINW